MTIREGLKRFCKELPQDFCPYEEKHPCNTNEDYEECEDCRVTFLLNFLRSQGKMVTVDKRGAIPHFHYQGSDKGLVSYDLAGEFEHGEEGCLIFIPKGKVGYEAVVPLIKEGD